MVAGSDSPLLCTASTEDGKVIMSMEHETLPIFGVQYHPESFMTPGGADIIDNFLKEIP